MTEDTKTAKPLGLASHEGLGPLLAFMRGLERDHAPNGWPAVQMCDITRMVDEIERLRGELACAAQDCFAAESRPLPTEWLVKVRRLVQGFEHVSGIARLWEPDYSSGSERALWSRATEACADVAKLLREAEGPNVGIDAGPARKEQR